MFSNLENATSSALTPGSCDDTRRDGGVGSGGCGPGLIWATWRAKLSALLAALLIALSMLSSCSCGGASPFSLVSFGYFRHLLRDDGDLSVVRGGLVNALLELLRVKLAAL